MRPALALKKRVTAKLHRVDRLFAHDRLARFVQWGGKSVFRNINQIRHRLDFRWFISIAVSQHFDAVLQPAHELKHCKLRSDREDRKLSACRSRPHKDPIAANAIILRFHLLIA